MIDTKAEFRQLGSSNEGVKVIKEESGGGSGDVRGLN